jgi:hypothetical protein
MGDIIAVIKALAWPGVVVLFLIRFDSSLRDLLDGIAEISISGGVFKASAKREKLRTAQEQIRVLLKAKESALAALDESNPSVKQIRTQLEGIDKQIEDALSAR